MAKYSPPAVAEVWWVTTIAVPGVPTAAELNSGVDGNSDVTTTPTLPRAPGIVDVATIDSKYEKRQVGTRGGDLLTFNVLRDDTTETFFDAVTEDTAGFLVVVRKGNATYGTFAVADVIDIYPATVAAVEDGVPGRNDADFAVISCVATDDPTRDFPIAA